MAPDTNLLNPSERKSLTEVLHYDPETGIFTWLVRKAQRVRAGDIAGSPSGRGHRRIDIDGVKHQGHRLAWLYMTGEWPPAQIDHRDTDKANNRWSNLRSATQAQNTRNCGLRRSNTTGAKGVTYIKSSGRWSAEITVDWKMHHLGRFASLGEAKAAYAAAAKRLHGEFARTA